MGGNVGNVLGGVYCWFLLDTVLARKRGSDFEGSQFPRFRCVLRGASLTARIITELLVNRDQGEMSVFVCLNLPAFAPLYVSWSRLWPFFRSTVTLRAESGQNWEHVVGSP